MKFSEKIAAEYLESLGYKNFLYEPDGNVPPDFLLNEKIAVETRILNKNVLDGGRLTGLGNISVPLIADVKKLVHGIGPAIPSASWYVSCTFRRPVPKPKDIRKSLSDYLNRFAANPAETPLRFRVTDNLRFDLYPMEQPGNTMFRAVSFSDFDAGGWIVADLGENLQFCLTEKTRKVAPYRHKYAEWWLVLIDYIGQGALDDRDKAQLVKAFKFEHDFDKVVIVNPQDVSQNFFI